MQKLSLTTLKNLPAHIRIPSYDPAALEIGSVHFGVGNFQRAHQAVYTEDAIEAIWQQAQKLPVWGICGVSLCSTRMREALQAQDFLYTLTTADDKNSNTRVMACLRNILVAQQQAAELRQQLASPAIKCITITVTEKGYCYFPATGKLNLTHLDISHDLQQWQVLGNHWSEQGTPRSLIGWLVLSLLQRFQQQITPFTIISCDNIAQNSHLLRELILQFCQLASPTFVSWLQQAIIFPTTMVDRITPATTPTMLSKLNAQSNILDNAPVITEPYSQWVIENSLSPALPVWHLVGAQLANDVHCYELCKLRLLNATHSALAYLGAIAGYEYIHAALADNLFKNFAEQLLSEITLTLTSFSEIDLSSYQNSILQRFANSQVAYRTYQVAMDGSQKLPQRIFPSLLFCYQHHLPSCCLSLVVAAWLRYLMGKDDHGQELPLQDPLAPSLLKIMQPPPIDINSMLDNLFSNTAIFPLQLLEQKAFRQDLLAHLSQLFTQSCKKYVATLIR